MEQSNDSAGMDAASRGRCRMLLASAATGLLPLMRAWVDDLDARTIAFIPNASFVERYGFTNRMVAPWWRTQGLHVRVVDLTGRRADVLAQLDGCDMLYVCGGNTFHLMRCLRGAGVVPLIRALVARGVPYVGESAGAVVTAPDIDYIEPMDERREPAATLRRHMAAPTWTPGLGLVDVHIVPHVGGRLLGAPADAILRAHAADPTYIGLRNDEALIVDGGDMRRVRTRSVLSRFM